MNYRPDRAIQISTLMTNPHFYKTPAKKEDGSDMWKPYDPAHPLTGIKYLIVLHLL